MLASELAALTSNAARDLRDSWQGRVLARASGEMKPVVLSVLAHNYPDAISVLLAVVCAPFTTIKAPFYCTAARILENGRVVADRVTQFGQIEKGVEIFASEEKMRDAFRRLADQLKLSDPDRIDLFECACRWVVCDFRKDPLMDPADPDARRYAVN